MTSQKRSITLRALVRAGDLCEFPFFFTRRWHPFLTHPCVLTICPLPLSPSDPSLPSIPGLNTYYGPLGCATFHIKLNAGWEGISISFSCHFGVKSLVHCREESSLLPPPPENKPDLLVVTS